MSTQERQIRDILPGKTLPFFPIRNPLYFSAIARFRATVIFRTGSNLPVFRDQKKAAKSAGFFLIKTARFPKYQIITIIVEGISTFSTGDFPVRIRLRKSPSEKRSWERDGLIRRFPGRGRYSRTFLADIRSYMNSKQIIEKFYILKF
jgi:hypothetical protein